MLTAALAHQATNHVERLTELGAGALRLKSVLLIKPLSAVLKFSYFCGLLRTESLGKLPDKLNRHGHCNIDRVAT